MPILRNVLYLLAFSMPLLGCGTLPKRYIDPAFRQNFNKFMQFAKERNVKIDERRLASLVIQFREINEDSDNEETGKTIGLCHFSDEAAHYVVDIDMWYWIKAHEMEQESLIFHELGHCLLARDHNDIMNGHVPVSIMHSMVLSPAHYRPDLKDAYRAYIDELFTHSQSQDL